jgi:MFS family permease
VTDRAGGGIGRFLLAACLADCSTYLVFTAVPLRVIAQGGGALILGLLPAVTAGVYVLAAWRFGDLADRWSRPAMVRSGAGLMAATALAVLAVPSLAALFAVLAVGAIGRALFWPAIQAEIGARGSAHTLSRRTGWFNVSWSGGKMIGFFVAGHLAQAFGTAPPLAIACVLAGAIPFLALDRGREGATVAGGVEETDAHPASVRRRFRACAWIANLVGYGVAATLNYHFPQRLLALSFREGDIGNFLGLMGLTQTASFAFLAWRHGWEYRPGRILLPLLLGMISVGALAFLENRLAILACAPGIGFALGVAYSASLYHSLHRESVPGRNAGIHESLLGSGVLVIPLVGGAMADRHGLAAPYLVGAASLAVALATGAVLLRPWRRDVAG